MKNTLIKSFVVAALLAGSGGWLHAEGSLWNVKMRRVALALSELVPFLYPAPGTKADVKGLTEKVAKLHEATESLDIKNDHMTRSKDFDPALVSIAGSFKEDVDRAYVSLQENQTEYAKYVLRDSTAYCIACHTRTSSGAQFPLVKAFSDSLKSAPWLTRMGFLAASRHVDGVMDEIMLRLKEPKSQALSPFDLEQGARLALSIAVRVKRDPELALKLARAAKSSKNAGAPLTEAATEWIKDIGRWQKEPAKEFKSAKAMLDEARKIVGTAKRTPIRDHDEVTYLRATALLHEMLMKFPGSSEMPEALYLIGESYTPLQEIGLWNLQEKYFRACIEEAPHSALAEKCYQRFEESVVFGYSGSSGTHLPGPLQRQLNQLKSKAEKPKEHK